MGACPELSTGKIIRVHNFLTYSRVIIIYSFPCFVLFFLYYKKKRKKKEEENNNRENNRKNITMNDEKKIGMKIDIILTGRYIKSYPHVEKSGGQAWG